MAVGATIKDAYQGRIRTGTVVEDLGTHWKVDWGPNRTRIRKDRVGKRPKRQGPWWAEAEAEANANLVSANRHMLKAAADIIENPFSRDDVDRALLIASLRKLAAS